MLKNAGWEENGGNGMESRKKMFLQGIICIVLLCLIWGGYLLGIKQIEKFKHREIVLCVDDFSWIYQVDSITVEEDSFCLNGFAFRLNHNALGNEYEIVLHDIDSGRNYFPKMNYVEREDVNKYFDCEYDYLKTGFRAFFDGEEFITTGNHYEVLLRVLGTKNAYHTGTFLVDGQIMFANPQSFKSPKVDGTDLEEIVDQGILRVYQPEYGMYVYQYEGALYWIAESRYEYDEDGNTYVQWHLETTQKERLPEERLENQTYFDNRGFYFREVEVRELNTGEYRVAKKVLPTEYAISLMNTGKYKGEWIWLKNFRPYYDFGKDGEMK